MASLTQVLRGEIRRCQEDILYKMPFLIEIDQKFQDLEGQRGQDGDQCCEEDVLYQMFSNIVCFILNFEYFLRIKMSRVPARRAKKHLTSFLTLGSQGSC